jgi:hypothetical protein
MLSEGYTLSEGGKKFYILALYNEIRLSSNNGIWIFDIGQFTPNEMHDAVHRQNCMTCSAHRSSHRQSLLSPFACA